MKLLFYLLFLSSSIPSLAQTYPCEYAFSVKNGYTLEEKISSTNPQNKDVLGRWKWIEIRKEKKQKQPSSYLLSLTFYSQTAEEELNHAEVIFKDQSKHVFQRVTSQCEFSHGRGYKHSALISLNKQEREMLENKLIEQITINHQVSKEVNEDDTLYVQSMAQCIFSK
ncbi:hypothetical protein BWI93_22900 [Siphonobacter sp. BAB-5385]|uniref:hypothetical protein n=1 Tax=unclassified Siphonobacter TaxID=2635712 RepID=UPI000B9E2AB9|nr:MULTISPECIES: hypothetical protein [unclassified Siphonobacter]OZI05762.1 hypothetical protein BWI93_22900 [Siphonobacter sp. BAB-5385]PMD90405.1 hypothetical protein BWI97_23280 [Siphonobacter sp. BAB-5405]